MELGAEVGTAKAIAFNHDLSVPVDSCQWKHKIRMQDRLQILQFPKAVLGSTGPRLERRDVGIEDSSIVDEQPIDRACIHNLI